MRVLIAHNRYQQAGGEDAVVAAEGALLAQKGHAVATLLFDNDQISGAWSSLQAGIRSFYSLPSHRRVKQAIERFRPDLVHVHNFFPTLSPSVLFAAHSAGVPTLQTIHNYRFQCASATLYRDGHICEACPRSGSFLPAVQHGCYRGSHIGSAIVGASFGLHRQLGTWKNRVHRYIALTEFAAQKLAAGSVPPERIRIKPNFVQDQGPGDGRGNFALYVGRLSEEKGVRTLLAACQDPSLQLQVCIAGDGPLRSEVQSAASQLHSRLQYLGPKSAVEIANLMRAAKVLIVPSQWYEGFPMVMAEALCAGLPVIASRIGGLPEIITEGECGYLATPGDPHDLVSVVNRFAKLPDSQHAALRAAARHRYLTRYDAESNYTALIDIYREALNTWIPSTSVAQHNMAHSSARD